MDVGIEVTASCVSQSEENEYDKYCGSALGAVDIGLFTGIHSSFRSGLRSLVFLAFPALCGDALRIICAQCFPSI